MNAASVQLFGAALDASDFARVTGYSEAIGPIEQSFNRESAALVRIDVSGANTGETISLQAQARLQR